MAREIVRAINNKTYDLDTIIDVRSNYNGLTVAAAIEKDRRCIMELVKKYGLHFTDAVVAKAGLKRTITHERAYCEVVEHRMPNIKQKYKKDTESVEKIIDKLNVLSSSNADMGTLPTDDSTDSEESTYIITAHPNKQNYNEDDEDE